MQQLGGSESPGEPLTMSLPIVRRTWRVVFALFVLLSIAPSRTYGAQPPPDPAEVNRHIAPQDRIFVDDPKSPIAGAMLYQFGNDGRLKYSHAAFVLPLNDPDWRAADAADYMKSDDPVLGLYYHGKSWALPWWVMKNYHVANLTVDRQALLIAFCEECSTGIAWNPIVNGRRLTFRAAGMYNGSILLTDDQTKSYWTPFTGEALDGPLKASKLKQMQLVQCRWHEWRRLHPQSLVAYVPEELRAGHGSYHFPGMQKNPFERYLLKPLDKRLASGDAVLGVGDGPSARTYPLSVLDGLAEHAANTVVLTDTLGKDEIVIFHERGSWLTTVFNRKFRGKLLGFSVDDDGRPVDSIYHSHWNYEGEALDGPVAGEKLRPFPSRVEEWYIWAAFQPGTNIYAGPGAAAGAGEQTAEQDDKSHR